MTPAELARLDAAATPGEWVAQSPDDGASDSWYVDTHAFPDGPEPVITPPGNQWAVSGPDAALIVFLRNHVTDFLAAMEERDRLRETLTYLIRAAEGAIEAGEVDPEGPVRMPELERVTAAARELLGKAK